MVVGPTRTIIFDVAHPNFESKKVSTRLWKVLVVEKNVHAMVIAAILAMFKSFSKAISSHGHLKERVAQKMKLIAQLDKNQILEGYKRLFEFTVGFLMESTA